MPPPEPRSSTVSPGFKSISAVGLPQPSEARTALSGNALFSVSPYRSFVMGSQQRSAGSQHATAPLSATLRAIEPYFSRTAFWLDISPSIIFAYTNVFSTNISVKAYITIMGRSSKSIDLARLFAALADPTRLRLLNLMDGREVCVCYFVEILKQSQPKISRHLAYLRNAGIVSARREGKWMHYSIERPEDHGAAAILDATLLSFRSDREMQADIARLG